MSKSVSSGTGSFGFRAVQLDLARQVENLDYIKSFVDFAASSGYNTLVLYLEGRIRTRSFPWGPKNESYSPEEMREVVRYAAKKKMDVIPVVSTLGHAEHFFHYSQLEGLAELRDGAKGRFSTMRHVFCPSKKETYKFLEAYFTEVAEIFPSKYFHAGCDEAWDIGYCDLCRERLKTETQSDIFARHLVESHRIVTKKLKKRMIIWDDLFENYPDALAKVPRDIVMCSWHYGKLVDKPTAHFGNKLEADTFALYDKMGFDYIFATAPYHFRNVDSLSSYAARRRPLGGLVTVWELATTFLYKSHPLISYAGGLWSGSAKAGGEAHLDALARTTGVKDSISLETVRAALSMSWRSLSTSQDSLLRGRLGEEEFERARVLDAALAALEGPAKKNDVAEDIYATFKIEAQYYALREAFAVMTDRLASKAEKASAVAAVKDCLKEVKSLRALRKSQWAKHRKNILPCNIDAHFDGIEKDVSALLKKLSQPTGVLSVSFFLPEYYSAQTTEILIRYEGSENWEKAASGCFKQCPSVEAFYNYKFLARQNKRPVAVRVESFGYGGQGLTFLALENALGRFIPDSISVVEGKVDDPQHLLCEDQKWCFLGDKDTRRSFVSPEIARETHVVQINLKKDPLS